MDPTAVGMSTSNADEAAARADYLSMGRGALAPYLMGMIIDAFLLGVVMCQFGTWWQFSRKIDRMPVRVLAWYCLLVSLGTSGYLVAFSVNTFAVGFGTFVRFRSPQWLSMFYLLTALSRGPVGIFFAERAWRLAGRSYILGSVLLILVTAGMVSAIILKVLAADVWFSPTILFTIIVWQVSELTADIITTTTIAVCLFRSKTGWKTTDKMISRLLILTAETMFPPTVLSAAFLTCVFAFPNSTSTYAFSFAPKVYVVCLFVVLNQRIKFRQGMGSTGASAGGASDHEPTYRPSRRFSSAIKSSSKGKSRSHMGDAGLRSVGVHTEVVTQIVHVDEPDGPGVSVNGRPLKIRHAHTHSQPRGSPSPAAPADHADSITLDGQESIDYAEMSHIGGQSASVGEVDMSDNKADMGERGHGSRVRLV